MARIAVGLEYDGSRYNGWQCQENPAMPSVQEQVERALSRVANHPVSILCAGRTDSGVHATGQVVHFDTTSMRPEKAWVLGGNSHLPQDIALQWAVQVPDDFHARFSALYRTYRYIILNRTVRSPALAGKATWIHSPLDAARMEAGARFLLGEHDFSAYRGSGCQSRSVHRNLYAVTVFRQGDLVITELTANAFLLHMVRNIMGVLLRIGLGEMPPEWAGEVLASRDRRLAAKTAPPDGLYLVRVGYPEGFALPTGSKGPAFLLECPHFSHPEQEIPLFRWAEPE